MKEETITLQDNQMGLNIEDPKTQAYISKKPQSKQFYQPVNPESFKREYTPSHYNQYIPQHATPSQQPVAQVPDKYQAPIYNNRPSTYDDERTVGVDYEPIHNQYDSQPPQYNNRYADPYANNYNQPAQNTPQQRQFDQPVAQVPNHNPQSVWNNNPAVYGDDERTVGVDYEPVNNKYDAQPPQYNNSYSDPYVKNCNHPVYNRNFDQPVAQAPTDFQPQIEDESRTVAAEYEPIRSHKPYDSYIPQHSKEANYDSGAYAHRFSQSENKTPKPRHFDQPVAQVPNYNQQSAWNHHPAVYGDDKQTLGADFEPVNNQYGVQPPQYNYNGNTDPYFQQQGSKPVYHQPNNRYYQDDEKTVGATYSDYGDSFYEQHNRNANHSYNDRYNSNSGYKSSDTFSDDFENRHKNIAPKKKKSKVKALITIILILAVIAGSAFAVWHFFFRDNAVDETAKTLFNDNLTPVCKGGKWGYMDKDGKLAIECQYEHAATFKEGRAAVQKDTLWGYIDTKGKYITKPRFVGADNFSEGLACVQDVNGLWGYIDKDGKLKIKHKYETAFDFSENYAAVKSDNKWGYINKEGNYHIKPEFDIALNFSEGLACVKEENLWGYIKTDGEYLTHPKYTLAQSLSDGYAIVQDTNNKYGIINSEGKEVVKCQFYYLANLSEGYIAVQNENKKWGFINTDGDLVVDYKYDEVSKFNEGLAIVAIKDANTNTYKFGHINTDGEEVIEVKYLDTEVFTCGLAMVKDPKTKEYYYVDKNDDKALDKTFPTADHFYNDGYAIVGTKDKKFYIIDENGKKIGDEYDTIDDIGNICGVDGCYNITSSGTNCKLHQ